MKKKNQAYLVALVAIGLVAMQAGWLATLGLKPFGTTTGTPDTPIVTTENKATVALACYDVDNGQENGKVGAQMEVSKNGQVVLPLTNYATGSTTLDANQGYLAGDKIVVRCINNTDTGYYENRVEKTLEAGVNSVAVPVKKVGTVVPSLTSATVAITSAGSGSIEYDLDISTQRQYFYKPIIAVKDRSSETAISSGNITSISCSGGHVVPCDTDTITGYSFCCQIDKEFISTTDSVADGKVFLYAGAAADPIGNLTMTIFDGVPFATQDGQASINRANAYDSTNTALSSAIVVT